MMNPRAVNIGAGECGGGRPISAIYRPLPSTHAEVGRQRVVGFFFSAFIHFDVVFDLI